MRKEFLGYTTEPLASLYCLALEKDEDGITHLPNLSLYKTKKWDWVDTEVKITIEISNKK